MRIGLKIELILLFDIKLYLFLICSNSGRFICYLVMSFVLVILLIIVLVV